MIKHWKKALPLLPLLLIWFFSTPEELGTVGPTFKNAPSTLQTRTPASIPQLAPSAFIKPALPNIPTPTPNPLGPTDWEDKLITALKDQGGGTATDIQIQRVKAFTWKYGGQDLKVESVIVSLRNEQRVKTTFRALIDPLTGKILETWDQPIIDPINPAESFGVKLDSRYHGI